MKNCFAYIRVSTVKQGQHGSSLQEQRDAIAAFAQRHDILVSEWFEDRETAAKKGRTQFTRMMAALEKRKAAGVVLHKIDRGARNLWDWARIQGLIESGIEVHFAHDNLDLRSRGGRLAADIQAVVAADYVRNLRDEVRKGMRGRLKQGLYPWRAPVGYLDQGKALPKIIDPIKGPLVRAAFELYATKRHSYKTLALALHARGLRRPNGTPLSLNGLTTLLRNPFYMGTVRLASTGECFPGVHEPLIEARLFREVQGAIDGKSNTKSRRFEFAYSRMLTCGLCQSKLIGELQKGRVYYRCHTRNCETKGVREDVVTAELREAAIALQLDEDQLAQITPMFSEQTKAAEIHRSKSLNSLNLQIAALEMRDKRLTDAYIDQVLDQQTYADRRSALLMELAEARQELARQTADVTDTRATLGGYLELVKAFVSGPHEASPREYRRVMEIITSNCSLNRKKLSLAMRSPFREISDDTAVLFGVPSRDVNRTPKLRMERAKILLKHLATWRPPDYLVQVDDTRPMKARPPQSFKRREPPSIEELL